jgi:hypothetical protein
MQVDYLSGHEVWQRLGHWFESRVAVPFVS